MATSLTHPPVQIDVVSDGVCPFCYLGRRKLEIAVDLHNKKYPNEDPISIVLSWHPFQLDPALPAGEGVPKKAYYIERFGPQFQGNLERTVSMAQSLGIKIYDEGNVGNTMDYHRLLRFVLTKYDVETQNKVVNALFIEYFEKGHPLSDHAVLLNGAESAGLDRAVIQLFLESDELKNDVVSEIADCKRRGIRGVPAFAIEGGRFNINGAEDPEAWLRIFANIRDDRLKNVK